MTKVCPEFQLEQEVQEQAELLDVVLEVPVQLSLVLPDLLEELELPVRA